MPASPRLIAGLSSSASAGPIGCTSGLDALELGALELGALDFEVLPGFLGVSGFFAMPGIWGESGGEKRANAPRGNSGMNGDLNRLIWPAASRACLRPLSAGVSTLGVARNRRRAPRDNR